MYFVLFSTLIESFFLTHYSKILGFSGSSKTNKIKSDFDIQAAGFKQKEEVKINLKIKELQKEIDELNSLSEREKTSDIKTKIASLRYRILALEEEKKSLNIK